MFRPWSFEVELSLPVIGGMAGMIVCGTILAYLFFLQGVRDAGPLLAGLLETVELVAAFAISAVWLGTPVGIWDIAGSVCIMAMMVMMTLGGAKGRGEGRASGQEDEDGETRASGQADGDGETPAAKQERQDGRKRAL